MIGGVSVLNVFAPYIKLSILTVILSFVIGYIFTTKFKGHILNNWNTYIISSTEIRER